jgi:NAD(P)-dependent dehydrogenase (short-subunit alcohol dehydrogenase family)
VRVAIVTGAGSGIGAATADLLARKGIAVAMVGRRADALEDVADRIRADEGHAVTIPTDLADPGAGQRIVERTLAMFGRVDVVVNNAGALAAAPLDEITAEMFDTQMVVNVRAPLMLVAAALPSLRRATQPAVVNVSSSAASTLQANTAAYGTSKAALEYLTRAMAYELGPLGIRVNCVAPGPVETPIHATYTDDLVALEARQRARVVLGRIAQPQEIARWVWWLSCAETDWTTGAIVAVDGGEALGPPP